MGREWAIAIIVCAVALSAMVMARASKPDAQFSTQINGGKQPAPILQAPQEAGNPGAVCVEGDISYCNVEGCGGTRYCIGGQWGGCAKNKPICNPGDYYPCRLSSICANGQMQCNQCADGYETCQPMNQSG
jgi:hypothetical protein